MKLLFLTFFLGFSSLATPEKEKRIILSLGEKTHLPLSEEKVIYTGNKNLLVLREQGSFVSLRAKKLGSTFLNTGQKTYQIFIVSKKEKEKIQTLDQFLKSLWGLTWFISENKILIRGKLNRLSDWINLSKLSKKYQISYEFKANLGEGLEPYVRLFFRQKFKNKTPPRIEWNQLPFVFIPEGEQEEFYKRELKYFGLIPKIDSDWFATLPFIKIDIALIEISKTLSSALGGTILSPKEIFSFASLLDFLNFLKAKGTGKIIHQSSLLAQPKQKVHLHSGGHLPFIQSNLQTQQQNLQWKSYGFNLTLTPYLDSFQSLKLEIKWEVSEPTSIPSPHSTPPLKSHKWKTTLQMKSGQILKLFHQNKKGHGKMNQAGILGFIPKNLSVRNNNYKKSEFLFIQPTILKNSDHKQNTLELKKLLK